MLTNWNLDNNLRKGGGDATGVGESIHKDEASVSVTRSDW